MKRIAPFLCIAFLLFGFLPAPAADEPELTKKEMEKLSTYMKNIFDAWVVDDRSKAVEAKATLASYVQSLEKQKNVEDLLKYPNLWFRVKEGAVDTSNKILKTKKGKGFQKGTFVDYTEIPERHYAYYMSVPKNYTFEEGERFPVIIFLHPPITKRGKKVDKEVFKMLKTLYKEEGFLDRYLIIAPLGALEGKRHKNLVDSAKDWESLEGRKAAFMAFRILMEQMVFDPTRVYMDGMGRAGLTAFRYATWYPTFFAGVIGRDAPLEPLAVENLGGIPFLYVSSAENDEQAAGAAKSWAEQYPEDGEEKALRFTFMEDAGTLTAPSTEAQQAALKWLDAAKKAPCPTEIHLKTADLEKAAAYWLRILELNVGLEMKLDDPDYPWIKAHVDREANSIVLESKRVLKVMILLNDNLLDLDKKVSVVFNGKTRFEGKVSRSLDKMLELIFYSPSYEVYCNYLELSEQE